MKEKFNDYESKGFINEEGDFVFEIKSCEIKDGPSGPMAVFEVEAEEGKTTIRHSLTPKARWSYNNLIAACLKLTTEKRKTFELDYETIGQELVGKKFLGTVEIQQYTKVVKVPQEDGTFSEEEQVKDSYKIVKYNAI